MTRRETSQQYRKYIPGSRIGSITLLKDLGIPPGRASRAHLFEAKCDCGQKLHVTTDRIGIQGSKVSECRSCKIRNSGKSLLMRYPEIAAEAYGWDPSVVIAGSREKREWICINGHLYKAATSNRTSNGQGCPICSNKYAVAGINDLKLRFPSISEEAFGWDPSKVMPGSTKKLKWKCPQGHVYLMSPNKRTSPSSQQGCPYCAGRRVMKGFNDLKTRFPDIATQAHGWDPYTTVAHSNKKVSWICSKGHIWEEKINNRTSKNYGCPICSGQQLLTGYNDLATLNPEIAAEADGWDPFKYQRSASARLPWRCIKCGFCWRASINSRDKGSGCPSCAKYGYTPSKPGWMYLVSRPGEQKFGITNNPDIRLSKHLSDGWECLDLLGPYPGDQVALAEASLRVWLKLINHALPGTRENWSTTILEVYSLSQLFKLADIEQEYRLPQKRKGSDLGASDFTQI